VLGRIQRCWEQQRHKQVCMPRSPRHALIWFADRDRYELYSRGRLERHFRPGDEGAWLSWLAAQTAFAFQGCSGRLNVHNEARSRGARYWYAYRATGRRTLKRYLGKTDNLTFARLEQAARELTDAQSVPRATLTQPHTALQKAEQWDGLLETKLAQPRLPAALVLRERLLRDLDAVFAYRLTLLSASAGWGKTTLLATWLASRTKGVMASLSPQSSVLSTRVAWLSLDALDNDLTRFWVAVIAALRTCVPEFGAVALAMLHSPQPPPLTTILTALLNDLGDRGMGDGGWGMGKEAAASSITHPPSLILYILILDDYHVIDDQAIHEALAFLLEHLPENLHLVLSSRVDPDLPLARWRVRGQLAEIRAADLRFTKAETATFFTQALGDTLAEDDVLRLERRTEGWVAGLQLAALAMRQREDRSAFVQAFSGSHRYLLDYVQEEVLERQPPAVQRFLLQTAVLRRLNADICAALTEDSASQAMLEALERNNLFVVPLDEQRQWYRVHDLFREALLARLHAIEPGLAPRLHQRAAQWYAAQGQLQEAVAHALAAQDFGYAAALMKREAPKLWLSGETQTVHTWVQALPDSVLWQYARLALDAALRLLESHHSTTSAAYAKTQAQVEQTIARVETVLQTQVKPESLSEALPTVSRQGPGALWATPRKKDTGRDFATVAALRESLQAASSTGKVLPVAEVALIQRRIRLLRALIATRAILACGDIESMRQLAREVAGLVDEEVNWKMIPLSINFWLTETLQHEGALLIPQLLEAKQQIMRAGDHLAIVRVIRWLTFGYKRAGRLRLVHQECLEALALLERVGGRTAMAGYLHFALAETYYAWNRLEEAARSLQQLLQIAKVWQQIDLQLIGYLLLAVVELAAGNPSRVQQALQEAEDLAQHREFPAHRFWVSTIRVRCWLSQGNLAEAGDWAEQMMLDLDTPHPSRKGSYLTLARVHIAFGRYTEALAALERFRTHLDRPDDIDIALKFQALHAVALHCAGKCKQAREITAQLLGLTEPEGHIRLYPDAGEPMRQILQSLLHTPYDQDVFQGRLPVAYITRLLAAFPMAEGYGLRTEGQGLRTESVESIHSVLSPQSPALIEPLTRREREVLGLLVAGASNQEIAARLVISLATVKKHVSNLLGKLGLDSRAQAIARARDWSIL
jgi:LuxR family transcriptional regulator, maltose regulon positive regulatory protein